MKRRFCPYCDQEMKTGFYCKGCRRIVLHPYEQEIHYYLNERHPQGEETCQYHGDLHTGSMKTESEVVLKRRSGHVDNRYHPAQVAENRRQAEKRMAAAGKQEKKREASRAPEVKKRRSLVPVFLFLWAVLTFGGGIFGLIGNVTDTVEDFGKAFGHRTPERALPDDVGQDGAESPEPTAKAMEETFEWEVSEEEVKKAGVACNSFGHYPVGKEELERVLSTWLETANFDQWIENGEYSFNQEIEDSTWYQTETEYELYLGGEYKGNLTIYSDTATGEVHGAGVLSWEEESFFEMADALAGTFSTLELLPEGVSGRDLYKEILAVNTEGLEGFSTQYGPEILCYETEDAGQPLYQMNLYAPGYYTDGE